MASDEEKDRIIREYLNFDFKAARANREAENKARNDELQKVLEAGPLVESNIRCMRLCCPEMRWTVPSTSSVLCREHTMEVFRGERRAPPIRRNIDYIATGRRTFLVSQLPDPKDDE